MNYNPNNLYTIIDLKKIIRLNEIHSDIIIRGGNIQSLGDFEIINGFLGIIDSNIESLGNLKKVKGDFYISSNSVYSNITSLEKLELVEGDLNLSYSNIKDLGALKNVGGKLNLRDTKINDLANLEFVGGDLFLPKRVEKDIDLINITVVGNIRFWNDNKSKKAIIPKNEIEYFDYKDSIPSWNHKYIYSFKDIQEASQEQLNFYKIYKEYFLNKKYIDVKGNHNYPFILFYDLLENKNSDITVLQNHLKNLADYYPKTKIYGEREIIKKLEDLKQFDKAWNLILQSNFINIPKIMDYESKLKRELLTGDLIIKLGGYSHLTEFGQKNINEIRLWVNNQIENYKIGKSLRFFDIFFKDGKPIKSNTNEAYDSEYYKVFFLTESEFEYYKSIDDYQRESGFNNPLPHIIEKAILNQFKLILKQTEDLYREKIGMPKVGEGWISETELYYKIANYFNNDEVIHHASPKWLGRQHLDIYFPKFNIGIEYQGAQHYEPVEFFGGQEAFEKTIERDLRKKQLCQEHKCYLICVEKGYVFEEIIKQIEQAKGFYNLDI